MKKLLGVAALMTFLTGAAGAQEPSVAVVKLNIPRELFVPAPGNLKKIFPEGMPLGIGSALTFSHKESDGSLVFWALSDRGPNGDSPLVRQADGALRPAKLFPAPDFLPTIGRIVVRGSEGRVETPVLTLTSAGGRAVTGLPLPENMVGTTGEVPLSTELKALNSDADGMDLEGLDMDAEGNFWVCDEYGPFIALVDRASGHILKKFGPGTGLPEHLANRQANRGFEGLAVTPSGSVLAALQSIVDVNGSVKKSMATFIPLVLLDPVTGTVRTYAYPHDVEAYKRSSDAKLGDVAAIDDHRFLIIEQGKGADKKMRNLVYLIDLSGATDVTKVKTADGKALETLPNRSDVEALGVSYVSKKLVADLVELGWKAEKAEGLAIVDEKTIALCSDNDFGLTVRLDGTSVDDLDELVVKTDGSLALKRDDSAVSGRIVVEPSGETMDFWLITLPETLR